MQHDLYPHPDPTLRRAFPVAVQRQSNVAEGDHRIVAPLSVIHAATRRPTRQIPIVRPDDQPFTLLSPWMHAVPARSLRRPVGSIAAWRDDITSALDWLLLGV